ncbi:hypothetical protein [Arthrobacter sp. efr-133-TYG-104]|uniref:hypothetical protein n=1 Tax=Arthrobacter sp. efr-133-TYG-104 TaxID=3040324 RepID=UPI00254D8E8E|nr:hypothetical protein [Arthrobacter sp. efr-133-TYG-104]
MRHSVVPALLLTAGLLAGPAVAAQAAPCTDKSKVACGQVEVPTQPAAPAQPVAPAPSKKPVPDPVPTQIHQPVAVPAVPAPPVRVPQPAVVEQAPAPAAPALNDPVPASSEPVPGQDATSAAATPSATPSVSPSSASPSSSPSTSSNWDTPVQQGQKTAAAILVANPGPGPNVLGLVGILGGVLLVGLGGLAFALWSKNRLSSH